MHYVLQYDLVDDYVSKRAAYRQQHLSLVSQAHERGELVIAGALVEPADAALLIFRAPEPAEAFAKADPYVQNGLVKAWRVRQWMTVVGDGAKMPV
ncbi:MAG TPA: YciI-like protein [Bryobacteraceae bacterium]|nr:YciI-like protein [Bryobacteraceae bacterium]